MEFHAVTERFLIAKSVIVKESEFYFSSIIFLDILKFCSNSTSQPNIRIVGG